MVEFVRYIQDYYKIEGELGQYDNFLINRFQRQLCNRKEGRQQKDWREGCYQDYFKVRFELSQKCRNQLTEDDKIGLMNEIEILMHVDHPNIVRLFEVFEDEQTYSLVMELMTGGEVSLAR